MDVLRAQTARRSLIAGRVSLALYKKGPTLSRVCGSPRGRAEVTAAVRVRGVHSIQFNSIHTKFKNPFQGKLTQIVVVMVRSMRVDGTILVHLIKVEGTLLEESGKEQG
jgi:hypothetical protein